LTVGLLRSSPPKPPGPPVPAVPVAVVEVVPDPLVGSVTPCSYRQLV
jgi:hypothetical protein